MANSLYTPLSPWWTPNASLLGETSTTQDIIDCLLGKIESCSATEFEAILDSALAKISVSDLPADHLFEKIFTAERFDPNIHHALTQRGFVCNYDEAPWILSKNTDAFWFALDSVHAALKHNPARWGKALAKMVDVFASAHQAWCAPSEYLSRLDGLINRFPQTHGCVQHALDNPAPIDEGTLWGEALHEALDKRDTALLHKILLPQHYGRPTHVHAFLWAHGASYGIDTWEWLSHQCAQSVACFDAWHKATTQTMICPDLFCLDVPTLEHAFGKDIDKHMLVDMFPNVPVDVLGVSLCAGRRPMSRLTMQNLLDTPQGEEALYRTALSHPIFLLSFFDVSPHPVEKVFAQLNAWNPQEVAQWRDPHGCCVGHYALAANTSIKQADKLLMRMLSVHPHWGDVKRPDGTPLANLFFNPQSRAQYERKELRQEVSLKHAAKAVRKKM